MRRCFGSLILLNGDVGLVKKPLATAISGKRSNHSTRPLSSLQSHDDILFIDRDKPVISALRHACIRCLKSKTSRLILADQTRRIEHSRKFVSAGDELLPVMAGDSLRDTNTSYLRLLSSPPDEAMK